MATTYDAIAYPTFPRLLAHPGHLYAVATMVGLSPAPPEISNILEIGCGDASHLIACAAAMPEATFTGFDLSSAAIERGQSLIRTAGLTNISIEVGDITKWNLGDRTFDYVIIDGIYSWVPAFVRHALISLVGRSLTENGLAYLSANMYPGCYTRRMLWEMMKFHVEGIDDPEQKIDEAYRMADFIRVCREKPERKRQDPFDRDVENVLKNRDRSILYHDELSPINEPVYFHRLASHLADHGLQFVSEVLPQSMNFSTLEPAVRERIEQFSGGDRIKREQYIDFATLRRFRQMILARTNQTPLRDPDPQAIRNLFLTSSASFETIDLTPDVPMTFRSDDREIAFDRTLTKVAMILLASCSPQRVTLDELLDECGRQMQRESLSDEEVDALLNDLVRAWLHGIVYLRGTQPRYVSKLSEQPHASALARAQVMAGPTVTCLLHTTIRFEDPPSRRLIELLDGTRTIDDLANEIRPLFPDDQRPSPDEFREGLVRNLTLLARSGFLVG